MKDEKQSLVGSSLLDFIYIVAKARIFLFIFVFTITAGAIILALLTPKEYKATASVLPAEQSDLLSSLTGISSLAKSFSPLKGLGSISGNEDTDKYIAILKSNTVELDLIDQFNLRKVYQMENEPLWKVEKKLSGNLDVSMADEGDLEINVFDEDPQRAADMANYMVDLLNNMNTDLHVSNAKSTREFIEKRYGQNKQDIQNLELQMKDFQQKYGVMAVPEQIESTVESISQIYVDLAKEEVQLNVLKKTLGEDNPMYKAKELEVQEIKSSIKNYTVGNEITKDPKVLIPLNVAPDLANKYLNIYKNLEIQYAIAEFITPVYEQAKIEEVRNTPSVQVLDKAYPPERKARPKIALYALIGFVVSLLVGLFIVFTLELFRRMQQINPQKYFYIRKSLKPFSKLLPEGNPDDKSQSPGNI